MNTRVRMMADARSLFWPWCIVSAAGILSLFSLPRLPGGVHSEIVAGIGFAIGLPLLATLVFGNEFQFGTLSSLLSQPLKRSSIWIEKSVVIVAAVLSAAIAYGFGAYRMGWRMQEIAIVALWLMITAVSSTYWTLVARSTIGGLVLNGLQSMALALASAPQLNKRPQPLLELAVFGIAYTAVMLYLGRRKFLQYQVTGTGTGSNLLAMDLAIAPNLLRCTASGGTLNLLCKELHLLWPLVPLTLIACGILLAVVPFRVASDYSLWTATVGFSAVMTFGLLTAILAGTLPLGEERSQGLHEWNMTQPIPVRRQWAIKLVTGLSASAACTGVIVLAARVLLGSTFLQEVGFGGPYVVAFLPPLTFVAFWCASGVNGTVRAAFWCVPAAVTVLVAYIVGISSVQSSAMLEIIRAVTAAVHPHPFPEESYDVAWKLTWFPRSMVVPALWVAVWLLPLAAIQSYRLFRSEIRGGGMPLIRQTLLLAAVALFSGFLQYVPAAATGNMVQNTAGVLTEISRGVAAMEIDPAAVSSESGYSMSLETISNKFALSQRTRAWIARDTLVILPKSAATGPEIPELEATRYIITAELHWGWRCAFVDRLFENSRLHLYVCKSKQGTTGGLEVNF